MEMETPPELFPSLTYTNVLPSHFLATYEPLLSALRPVSKTTHPSLGSVLAVDVSWEALPPVAVAEALHPVRSSVEATTAVITTVKIFMSFLSFGA
jgi:hypothetical protein